ncbi:MAG: MaoC family dehydratase [Rhizobiaceae bacterium]
MSIDKSGKPPVRLEDLKGAVGTEIGISPWREVTQDMISQFADVTDDFNFIHVDPERARAETPFGGTIAHGFLSLSLLSTLAYETIPALEGRAMGINYGFDSIRFAAPVKSGARVRAKFDLANVKIRPSGYIQIAYDVTMEIEGSVKPAFTARWLTIAIMEEGASASDG